MSRFAKIAFFVCAMSVLTTASVAAKTETKGIHNVKHSLRTVKTFGGIGNRDGSLDYGFSSTSHKDAASDINEKKREGIKLSPGMQKFADGAGRTLKNIDKALLDVVEEPFKWFGLQAESAKLRPAHKGVGLGVSIKLHRDKKNAAGDTLHKKDDSQEFYDLLKPTLARTQ